MKTPPESMTQFANTIGNSAQVAASIGENNEAFQCALSAVPTAILTMGDEPQSAPDFLQSIDPEAAELWRIKGPRGTKIDAISDYVIEVAGVIRRVNVRTYTDGTFKVFAEVAPETLGVK